MSWVAYGIGGFYIFAGVVVLRSIAMERLIDRAIDALSGKKEDDPLDARRLSILTVGAWLTLASGAALALLSPLASLVFGANVAVQGGYLVWAERALPPESPLEARGRQQTKNAFVVYLVATAFVVWLQFRGGLRPWPGALEALAFDVVVIGGVGLACWAWLHLPRGWLGSTAKSTSDAVDFDAVPGRPVEHVPTTRLRFSPEWQCWPLWDPDAGLSVDPHELPLSADLVERIAKWDDAWQATYNGEDPAASGFADPEQLRAYEAEGREIAAALKGEWQGELEIDPRFA